MNPEVDTSPEPFEWGLPDIVALREFAKFKVSLQCSLDG